MQFISKGLESSVVEPFFNLIEGIEGFLDSGANQ
jgi:hypothetical protein